MEGGVARKEPISTIAVEPVTSDLGVELGKLLVHRRRQLVVSCVEVVVPVQPANDPVRHDRAGVLGGHDRAYGGAIVLGDQYQRNQDHHRDQPRHQPDGEQHADVDERCPHDAEQDQQAQGGVGHGDVPSASVERSHVGGCRAAVAIP